MRLPRQRMGLLGLSLLAVVVGAVTGVGAVVFRALIAVIHNAFFLGTFTFAFDANQFTPASPWGPFIILVPVIGGLIVVFLVTTFAPEARGHGVPEVLDAIYYKEGKIRPVVAAIKSLASAFSIGSGAAVGREGPIIQIGATLGSTFGQSMAMPPWQRITLVAAGAGAGIAATFNTPIGGVMFAIELMMPEVSARTFLPVALATGTATFVGRFFLGMSPAFDVPAAFSATNTPEPLVALLLFAVLGGLAGLGATAFVRSLSWAEDAFLVVKNPYLRHVVGMLMVGVLIYALFELAGHYYVQGVGYATIQALLNDNLGASFGFLLFLFFAKLFATCVSLGSGSSGGIFSPSLFMGATLGGAFGALVTLVHPVPGVDAVTCAMVGMAAMVGGATGAAMAAVTMIFEMTRDYEVIMPIIVAVAVSIGIRRLLSRENIYTIKLVGRGHTIPKAMHANMFLVRHASEVMDADFVLLPAETPFAKFLRDTCDEGLKHIVVTRGDRVVGVLRVNTELRRGLEDAYTGVTLGELVRRRGFTIARPEDVVFDVVDRMWKHKAPMAIVAAAKSRPRPSQVVGVIDKEHIADSVAESVRPYSS
ncbi:chloride channel protein [Rhodovulum sp. PH10]|uniref:chloride channel protein n=1 Tax=Rhodovulum sp. PH10 TaxID=1187851 RepID=UPI00058CC895|nr:chloride channel protein [Rhodovulum sp. PH10]